MKPKNIWFYCPACDEKLVVGAEGAGLRADCPECGKSIPIPLRSTALPSWVNRAGLYAAQVAVLLGGIGIGWWLLAPEVRESAVADVAPNAAPVEPAVAAPENVDSREAIAAREINQQLLRDHVELKDRYDQMLAWMMENYRGKYPLPERLVSRLRIAPMTDSGEVSPDLAEVLRLSGEEKELVRDIMLYVRASLERTERERVRLVEQNDLLVSYEVPVYADVGGALKEDLFLALEKTLGAARLDRMLDMAGEAMREQMNYYGEASRKLTFEVIMPPSPGVHPPYLLIRDGWMIPEGDSVRLTRVKETAVMNLPESYRVYEDWLPEDLLRYTLQ